MKGNAVDVLVTEELNYSYGKKQALRNVDLRLPCGVTGLLGPNGAGKSTLMELLTTSRTPRSGRVLWRGQPLTGPAVGEYRKQLGYLPQKFGYSPSFSAAKFLRYVAWLRKMDKDAVDGAVESALARVDMESQSHVPLRKLSGGMRQRIGIAQAIMGDPDVIVLDEPTVGLDPEQRFFVRKVIRELGNTACVLLSTHLTEDIKHGCRGVVVMNHGTVLATTSVNALEEQGHDEALGDTPLERGYHALLRLEHREIPEVATYVSEANT